MARRFKIVCIIFVPFLKKTNRHHYVFSDPNKLEGLFKTAYQFETEILFMLFCQSSILVKVSLIESVRKKGGGGSYLYHTNEYFTETQRPC